MAGDNCRGKHAARNHFGIGLFANLNRLVIERRHVLRHGFRNRFHEARRNAVAHREEVATAGFNVPFCDLLRRRMLAHVNETFVAEQIVDAIIFASWHAL